MSTNKTASLGMHSWVGTDPVLMSEFNDNFDAIDAAIAAQSAQSASHAARHASGGADPVTPAAIGAAAAGHTHTAAAIGAAAAGHTHTPASIGAAAASHGTHVSYATTAPAMNGTASAGTAAAVARGDHVHPVDTSRAAASHTHTPASIGAAAASHGTHVTYSTTAPVMDGTASAGSAATVARSDHKHPTDTSRAAASHGTHVTFSTTAPVMDGTAAVGTATTVARSDHKHPTDTSRAASSHNHAAANITSGTLGVAYGGTGKASWTANRLVYPSAATTMAQLAFPTAAGSVLRQGTSGAPYWTSLADLQSAMTASAYTARFASGSYVGTGTYGSSGPCRLTFPFEPKLIWFARRPNETGAWNAAEVPYMPTYTRMIWVPALKAAMANSAAGYKGNLGKASAVHGVLPNGYAGFRDSTNGTENSMWYINLSSNGLTLTWYSTLSADWQNNLATYTHYWWIFA